MKEIKLKNCPCCGNGARFMYKLEDDKRRIRVECYKCNLSTGWVDESLDYGAKEETAKVWNKQNIHQDNYGGITADELERALEESMKEFNELKPKGEVKRRKIPKCTICGHRSYSLREINSDSFNTYVLMVCKNCNTKIRTNEKNIDKFFMERLVQDIEK